jgi:ATP-dependent RNA helicase DDX1
MSGGFEDLGLLPELVRATQEQGWLLPSDIQDEAIPLILGGGDVMAAAETGSGKTAAFALPGIQIAHEYRRTGRTAASSAVPTGHSSRPAKKARIESSQLSVDDRSPMLAISSDGLSCQCRQERDWAGVRSTKGVLRGKFYYEALIRDDGLCRFGWSTASASLDLGTDRFGFGFGGTGRKSNNRAFDMYGVAFGRNDVIGCYLDAKDSGAEISFSKNGSDLGLAFLLPKSVGALYPAIALKNGECFVNFGGSTAFQFPPRAGFVGVDSSDAGEVVMKSSVGVAGGAASLGVASSPAGPIVIVLTPARDLAEQTHKAFVELCRHVVGPAITASLIIGMICAVVIEFLT